MGPSRAVPGSSSPARCWIWGQLAPWWTPSPPTTNRGVQEACVLALASLLLATAPHEDHAAHQHQPHVRLLGSQGELDRPGWTPFPLAKVMRHVRRPPAAVAAEGGGGSVHGARDGGGGRGSARCVEGCGGGGGAAWGAGGGAAGAGAAAVAGRAAGAMQGAMQVLAGVLHTVRTHVDPHPQIVWLTRGTPSEGNAMPKHCYGLVDWLGDSAPGSTTQHDWHNWDTKAKNASLVMRQTLSWGPVDMVVCISPELETTQACHAVAATLRARLIVTMAHRADIITRSWRFLRKGPVPLHVLTLAPHVQIAMKAKLDLPVSWALPVAPFTHPQPCMKRSCLSGFAVQGTVRRWVNKHGGGLIRDFDGLWKQMLLPHAASIKVKVLGRGERQNLDIPPALDPRVTFYRKLPYPAFWSTIADSLALVPAFGHPLYMTSRISSTALASLTTCTPMLVSRAMLYVYSFLREEHVFLQHDNETDVDTMLRVEAMGEQELFAKRRALCELRDRLNTRAAQLLVDLAKGRAGSGDGSSDSSNA